MSLPIFSLLFGFALMLAIGTSVVAGKYIGENDINSASEIFTKAILTTVIFGFFSYLFISYNIENVLSFLGADDSLFDIAFEYLSIILIFIPFLMIEMILDYFVRVDNRPNLAFIALLSSAFINIVLDYVFIVYFQKGIFGAS